MNEKVYTNNHRRDILYFHELDAAQQEAARSDYDWHDTLEDDAEFFIYKGYVYILDDFMRLDHKNGEPDIFQRWDGYLNDTLFSGIVIRWAPDWSGEITGEYITVGTFY